MKKKATTIDEQINLLQERGMTLDDGVEKTKEELLDIGYFRIGFYCFPFEENPHKQDRDHVYVGNSKFSNVIKLYYLDFELRNILLKYIHRIEINFRTKVIYYISNQYIDSPTWFVDPLIMQQQYICEFDIKVYNAFKENKVIKTHHRKHVGDKYAPAWKTLEYMTFGSILTLLDSVKDDNIKNEIASIYGIRNYLVLKSYMKSIIYIRNICAHGGVLFDYRLPKSIKTGPAIKIDERNKNSLYAVIKIILFILNTVSENRANDMEKDIKKLLKKHTDNHEIKRIIKANIYYDYE